MSYKFYDLKWQRTYEATRDDGRTVKLVAADGHTQIFSLDFFKKLVKDKQIIKQ